mmetsp:Transcript_11421/g.28922  ORF Transcript_11421/g.28922 Transcript_11421/m.28922 type:complete len:210 (-) Transcript_11421:2193-2822(-)
MERTADGLLFIRSGVLLLLSSGGAGPLYEFSRVELWGLLMRSGPAAASEAAPCRGLSPDASTFGSSLPPTGSLPVGLTCADAALPNAGILSPSNPRAGILSPSILRAGILSPSTLLSNPRADANTAPPPAAPRAGILSPSTLPLNPRAEARTLPDAVCAWSRKPDTSGAPSLPASIFLTVWTTRPDESVRSTKSCCSRLVWRVESSLAS